MFSLSVMIDHSFKTEHMIQPWNHVLVVLNLNSSNSSKATILQYDDNYSQLGLHSLLLTISLTCRYLFL